MVDGAAAGDIHQAGGTLALGDAGGAAAAQHHLTARIPLQDLTIVEPDLEEVFMHYYREEDAK